MPRVVAGERLRGTDLQSIQYTSLLQADQIIFNSAADVVSGGLSLELLPGTYALEGFIIWSSPPAADMVFRWNLPVNAIGVFTMAAPRYNTTPVAGSERINHIDFGSITATGLLGIAGDDEFTTVYTGGALRGFVTVEWPGDVRIRFAQFTPVAADTILRAGSWIRATRMDLT